MVVAILLSVVVIAALLIWVERRMLGIWQTAGARTASASSASARSSPT